MLQLEVIQQIDEEAHPSIGRSAHALDYRRIRERIPVSLCHIEDRAYTKTPDDDAVLLSFLSDRSLVLIKGWES